MCLGSMKMPSTVIGLEAQASYSQRSVLVCTTVMKTKHTPVFGRQACQIAQDFLHLEIPLVIG